MEALVVAAAILAFGLILLTAEAFFPGGYLLIPGGVLVIVGVFGLADRDDLFTWVTAAVAIVAAVPGTAGSDTWSADSDSPIPVGTEVTVVSSEGVHVHVAPKKG